MVRTFWYFFLLSWLISANLWAQIGISGKPHPSAVLDLQSPTNDKVFYPPRLTTPQRLAVVNPQPGALVYDLDKATLYLYEGQNWLPLLTTDARLLAPISRTASDGAGNDNFGISVAIAGDYALIGAPTKSVGSNAQQGVAYVFVRMGNSWMQQQQLVASDGSPRDSFGKSVAISGDYALVGAPTKAIGNNNNAEQGAAYVFVRSGSTWTQQQQLLASDGESFDRFSSSVAISGDYALVSSPTKAITTTNGKNDSQGAAYIFVRSGSTWTQQQRLVASDGVAFDNFGRTVALSGDYALIGEPTKAVGTNDAQGVAYMFRRSGSLWTQQQRLVANDGAANDLFGNSVAVTGDLALIGAYHKAVGTNTQQGAAYVFTRSGNSWTQQQRLVATDGVTDDIFGSSVALSGNTILIGAPNKTVGNNTQQGAAYVFTQVAGGSWLQQQRVVDNSPIITFNGFSVGLSNGTYIIGGYGYQGNQGKVSFGTTN